MSIGAIYTCGNSATVHRLLRGQTEGHRLDVPWPAHTVRGDEELFPLSYYGGSAQWVKRPCEGPPGVPVAALSGLLVLGMDLPKQARAVGRCEKWHRRRNGTAGTRGL